LKRTRKNSGFKIKRREMSNPLEKGKEKIGMLRTKKRSINRQ
jgi:hypothetical protein